MSGCDAGEIFSSVTRFQEGRLRRWGCRMVSLILHGLALTVAVLAAGLPRLLTDPGAGWQVSYIFVPPPDADKHLKGAADVSGVGSDPRAGDEGAKLDLKGIRLAIEQDPGYRMVESALRRYRGTIGLALPTEPAFVTYAFVAPGWGLGQGELLPIESFFTIVVEQPARWELLQTLRTRHGLEGNFLVYALFPPEFIPRLHTAIRRAAAIQAREGRVTEARIAFSSASPEGFRIVDVAVVAGAGQRKAV
jgi:hypothetical protein